MSSSMTGLELRSTIATDGVLRVTLENVPVQEPGLACPLKSGPP